MKKIFAIAIALVMVFAIASTAFAGIGFPLAAVPAEGITVDVIGLTETAGVFQSGTATYLKYDQTQGILAGSDLTFLVSLANATAVASATELRVRATNVADNANFAITGTPVTGASGASHTEYDKSMAQGVGELSVAADGFTGTTYNGTFDVAALPANNVNYILFEGFEAATTANVVVTATYRGVTESFQVNGTITITKGGKDYDITKYATTSGADYEVLIKSGLCAGWTVTFHGATRDAVNYDAAGTTVANPGGQGYQVNMNNTIVDFATGQGGADNWLSYYAPALYPSYLAAYNEVCGIFGWSFNGTPYTYLNDDGFEAYAGSARAIKDSWTYYAYTNALTVQGSTAAIPDTGDMSVVGIALAVVAVLGAAAIVIKKVRA